MKIIDITQELFSCNVYPGDKQPTYERVCTIAENGYNLTTFSMSVHNGTHMDAPGHFVAGRKSVHELDLSIFYGPCTVVEVEGEISGEKMAAILKSCQERLLIKGDCSFSEASAVALAASHVRLIGIEGQSVGSLEDPAFIHVIMLEKDVIPLEGLVLTDVAPGEYTLAAFPLLMEGSDGSPVRAVLISQE